MSAQSATQPFKEQILSRGRVDAGAIGRDGQAGGTCRASPAPRRERPQVPTRSASAERTAWPATSRPTSRASGAAISIEADDVLLDLDGYVLDGSASPAVGIHAAGRSRITVRNGTVRGFRRGIVLEDASPELLREHWIEAVRVTDAAQAGIWVEGSHSTVIDSQVSQIGGGAGDAYGIVVSGSAIQVVNNDVSDIVPGSGARAWGAWVRGTGGVLLNRLGNTTPGGAIALLLVGEGVRAESNRITRTEYGIVYGEGSEGEYRANLTKGVAAPFVGGTDAGDNH